MYDGTDSRSSLLYRSKVNAETLTWDLADPKRETAGRTASGGTGKTVINIQSGLANLGFIPVNHYKRFKL